MSFFNIVSFFVFAGNCCGFHIVPLVSVRFFINVVLNFFFFLVTSACVVAGFDVILFMMHFRLILWPCVCVFVIFHFSRLLFVFLLFISLSLHCVCSANFLC